jgi:hypothetical protein
MKTSQFKMIAVGMVLSISGLASLASAYGGGPGYDDHGRGGYDQGRGGDRRPGPGPGPGRGEDLCEGRYVGYYSNGFQAVIDFSHRYGDNIDVNVLLNNQPLSGSGSCRQYGDRAQWEFTTLGVLNRGTIDRGHMSGGQPGGASLSADRRY